MPCNILVVEKTKVGTIATIKLAPSFVKQVVGYVSEVKIYFFDN